MIIFLYGQDAYSSRQRLKEIVEDFNKENLNKLDIEHLDGKKIDFQGFRDGFQTISMFSKKKLIVLSDVFSNSELKKEILDFLKKKKDLKEVIIFYEEGEVKKEDSLFKFLKNNAQSQEFKSLEIRESKDWIVKEFEKYKVKISPEIPEILIKFIGNDLWRLSNEIKKIATFKIKKREKVSLADIVLLTKSKIETDIFTTVDAFSSGDKKKALTLIHRHLEKGDSPLYLLSMLKFQINNLLIVRDLVEKQMPFSYILNKSNLHPFVVRKNWRLAQKFTLEQLKKIYRKIFKLELKIKTGKIDPVLALDILIAEI